MSEWSPLVSEHPRHELVTLLACSIYTGSFEGLGRQTTDFTSKKEKMRQ
jgi:hypothetical protein